jgi:hypothetical protein
MPDLPSGTVTFLFTDIEGSTARCQAAVGDGLGETRLGVDASSVGSQSGSIAR